MVARASEGVVKSGRGAGPTAAAPVIPKAMAPVGIAGQPAEGGFCTGVTPMVIYAILGASRPLGFSTSWTIAVLLGGQLALLAPDGDPGKLIAAASRIALLAGALLLLAAVFRLAFMTSFIRGRVLRTLAVLALARVVRYAKLGCRSCFPSPRRSA
jgi:sulfate permease, SulP family